MKHQQTVNSNVLYAYMACPYCSPFSEKTITIYSPWACVCQKCGKPLEQCDFPHDPTDKENRQKNLEFMSRWWKEHKKWGVL